MFKERIKTHHSAMGDGKQYVRGMKTVGEVLSCKNPKDEGNATIYIHVPFCNKICSFCNMRRSLQKPSEQYGEWIRKEIRSYASLPYVQTTTFDAVYFGGGTPTTLSTEELCGILAELKENFRFTADAEFTIETTVTELDEEKADRLVMAGVNRFSVGIQTFDDAGRKKMGRIGSGEVAYERLKYLKKYPGVTVSMDLIYNYPEQTMESLFADLDKIVALDLDGFSMYSLIDMKGSTIDPAQGEKNDEAMFSAIADKMKAQGYFFLELTKMVKRDRYKYIMNRHRGADTLPLGAGAGGSVGNLALMNPIDLSEYEKSVEQVEKKAGMLFDPSYGEIVRFKGAIQTARLPENESLYRDEAEYKAFLQKLLENNMVEAVGSGAYSLTEKGIFWGNTISRELYAMIS